MNDKTNKKMSYQVYQEVNFSILTKKANYLFLNNVCSYNFSKENEVYNDKSDIFNKTNNQTSKQFNNELLLKSNLENCEDLYNKIKSVYSGFKKNYEKKKFMTIIKILEIDIQSLDKFVKYFLCEKDYLTIFDNKYKPDSLYLNENNLFSYLDEAFNRVDFLVKYNNNFSSKKISVNDFFKKIFFYLFNLRDDYENDNEIKDSVIHDPSFMLSINILYLLYFQKNINTKNEYLKDESSLNIDEINEDDSSLNAIDNNFNRKKDGIESIMKYIFCINKKQLSIKKEILSYKEEMSDFQKKYLNKKNEKLKKDSSQLNIDEINDDNSSPKAKDNNLNEKKREIESIIKFYLSIKNKQSSIEQGILYIHEKSSEFLKYTNKLCRRSVKKESTQLNFDEINEDNSSSNAKNNNFSINKEEKDCIFDFISYIDKNQQYILKEMLTIKSELFNFPKNIGTKNENLEKEYSESFLFNIDEINGDDSNSSEKDNNFTRKKRERLVESIKKKLGNKTNFKNEDFEKRFFRDFKKFLKINKEKEDFKKIIDKNKTFWDKFISSSKYSCWDFKKYSQQLLQFLFKRADFNALYEKYKKDPLLWHLIKPGEKQKKEKSKYDNNIYILYKNNLDKIYNPDFTENDLELNSLNNINNIQAGHGVFTEICQKLNQPLLPSSFNIGIPLKKNPHSIFQPLKDINSSKKLQNNKLECLSKLPTIEQNGEKNFSLSNKELSYSLDCSSGIFRRYNKSKYSISSLDDK